MYIVCTICATQSDEALREVVQNEEFSSLILETGLCKPLPMLKLEDKEVLCTTLCHYFTMLRGQCELDQFIVGLMTCGVLQMVCKHPELMKKPISVAKKRSPLSKGVFSQVQLSTS